ncbi:VOC family protein [Aeromicrobium sp. A1-2]
MGTGLGLRVRDLGGGWTVMADPEGNEFCVFPTD